MLVTVAQDPNQPGVGRRLVHEGIGFLPGQSAEVPEDVARRWAAKGWIDQPEFPTPEPEPIHSSEIGRRFKTGQKPKRRPGDSVTFPGSVDD